MTIKDYAEVLKFAIKMQIEYEKEALENPRLDYEREMHIGGVISGLQIALEKIDASKFLMENK